MLKYKSLKNTLFICNKFSILMEEKNFNLKRKLVVMNWKTQYY